MHTQKKSNLVKNEKGQLTIFLAVSVILILSLMAFVVNIGIFVKSKINLQNAVDSAAWSGAAVQARQLTNIAHLNLEMRNSYKEWMFKYYVLGQLSNQKTHNVTTDKVDFRLRPFDSTPNTSTGDRYNFPSTCLHFASTHNICNVYQVPGLPRFNIQGLPNVSEQFKEAVDSFVKAKASNCSQRSAFNFESAMSYAYSMGTFNSGPDSIPVTASFRKGAWIESMELALRMRNLEMILNRPPVTQGICPVAKSGCVSIGELVAENGSNGGIPFNERPQKAFWAGFRNISGGDFKLSDAMANNFKLKELAPRPYSTSANKLSGFLIPDLEYPLASTGGMKFANKHYVDLVPNIFNFVTFFTTFASRTQSADEINLGENVPLEGACASTKTAIPIPGYILGFYKNPEVLTYYAVKAETTFQGLLNPFKDGGMIDITAYAAAKPMGGRIGPMLVKPNDIADISNSTANTGRDNSSRITAHFVTGLQPSGDPRTSGADVAGAPLPFESGENSNGAFYVTTDSEVLGGIPASGDDVFYGIPNMMYIYPTSNNNSDKIELTEFYSTAAPPSKEDAGLYSKEQYLALRQNLPPGSSTAFIMGEKDIELSILRARAPTNFDAANYLVPTMGDDPFSGDDLENIPTIRQPAIDNDGVVMHFIFAPLIEEGSMYQNAAAAKAVIINYINNIESSVDSYIDSLKTYAQAIKNSASSSNVDAYAKAANGIHELTSGGAGALKMPGGISSTNGEDGDCQDQSIASRFHIFFKTEVVDEKNDHCNIISLKGSFEKYISNLAGNDTYKRYYEARFLPTPANPAHLIDNANRSSAYMPGTDHGASDQGVVAPASSSSSSTPYTARRNFYSTKFVPVLSVAGRSGDAGFHRSPIKIFMEDQDAATITGLVEHKNKLDISELSEFTSLDF